MVVSKKKKKNMLNTDLYKYYASTRLQFNNV